MAEQNLHTLQNQVNMILFRGGNDGYDDVVAEGDEIPFPFHLLLSLPILPILESLPPSKNPEKYFWKYFSVLQKILLEIFFLSSKNKY